MAELELFYKIKEAYETSTKNDNRFSKVLDEIEWSDKFYEDNEYYFVKGSFLFITPSLYPFNMPYKASVIFADGTSKDL